MLILFKKIVKKIYHKLYLLNIKYITKKESVISYCGYNIFYNTGNALVNRIKGNTIYEKDLCNHISNSLKSTANPFVIDIGANIGLISLFLIREVPSIKIFAFEPGPVQFQSLKKTVYNNKLEHNIQLNNLAVSDKSGIIQFFSHPYMDMAKDGIRNTERGEKTVIIEVKSVILDEWWINNQKPKINAIKIDTEGSELLVLKGSVRLLQLCKPVIYLEIVRSNLKAFPYKEQDIAKFFDEIGYQLFTLKGGLVNASNITSVMLNDDTFQALPK